jgi:hypothetical protein
MVQACKPKMHIVPAHDLLATKIAGLFAAAIGEVSVLFLVRRCAFECFGYTRRRMSEQCVHRVVACDGKFANEVDAAARRSKGTLSARLLGH